MRTLLLVTICFSCFCGFVFGQVDSKPVCPSISLSGPAGLTRQGERIVVRAKLSSNDRAKFKYSWSLDKGTIVAGLDSYEVSIDTGRLEMDTDSGSTQIIVNLEITDRATGCVANTLGQYGVYITKDFFPSDIYGNAPFIDEKARLDNLATQVLNSKKMIGYIIKGFKTGTSETDIRNRIERIKNFLFVTRKYPRDRFVILIRESNEIESQLWRWPSTETFPMCERCRSLP